AGDYTKGEDLDYQTVSRVITEGYDMGIHFITISGGEPLLWGDLLRLFSEHNDVYFQIYTNGTLIDEQMARELASLGNVAPAISVEGLEKETDDRRGKGTFARIMTAMEKLKENGVMFGFSATPTRQNSDLLASEEFIDFYIEKGCFFGWYFQYIPIGRNPDINLMSTPQQRNRLREMIHQWRANKPIFIGDFWNDGPYVGGCIAGGRQYLHINHKGDVEPCVFTHFALDNIKTKSLKEILKSDFFRMIREKQPYTDNLYVPCMIIDNPQVLREIVALSGAHPTHQGAESVISDPRIKAHLDRYAAEMHRLTDDLWEKTQEEFYFGRLQNNQKKEA
ncbi:MAG: radical SAM protein, partial [Candidatus Aminicenantes bacterium]|nr:radical SAM protein [Candidatus Aminicenantes bacterium]